MKLVPEETTNAKEATVARSRGCSLVEHSFRFGEVDGAKKSHEWSGLDGWPGRFWLPAHNQGQPSGKACLSRAFGPGRGTSVDGFEPRA